jgi:hypothetical protein
MLRTILADRVHPAERPWMIVLADTRVFGYRFPFLRRSSDPAVRTLLTHGVPVILVSPDRAARVRALQRVLGIRAPFIGAGGDELHVPGGYFDQMLGLGATSTKDWNVIRFDAPTGVGGFSGAIRKLLLLYWSRRDEGKVVGVTDRDPAILQLADIPILVRNPRIDQRAVRAQMPDAYYTTAAGSAGWAEGILGPVEQ